MASSRRKYARTLREESNLPREGWSDWKKAMVPNKSRGSEKRGPNQSGYMWSNIKNFTDKVAGSCGIYEWRATKPNQPDVPNTVVYVGSTCHRNGQFPRLGNRILGYCRDGNHKTDLINDALERGYDLEVRYRQAANEATARQMENDMLATYNYAWNIRNNAVRDVL